jgi:hypothetical protein
MASDLEKRLRITATLFREKGVMLTVADEAEEAADELARLRAQLEAMLCSDCPPIGYPTDKTRCTPCPRRAQVSSAALSGRKG